MGKYIRAILKIFLVCLVLAGFFIQAIFFNLIRWKKENRKLVQRYCALALWVLNIKLSFRGEKPDPKEIFLIVSNHLSYLDGFILYSFLENPCFTIGKDILESKYLGILPRYAEGYGVDRKSTNNLKEDISSLKNILDSGQNVVLFPEGTTGKGKELKQFKSSLFETAVLSQKKVLPLCLNYTSINDNSLNENNKGIIFWQEGEYPILKHFFRFCQNKKIECEITFTPPLSPQETSRQELSTKAYNSINKEFKPI